MEFKYDAWINSCYPTGYDDQGRGFPYGNEVVDVHVRYGAVSTGQYYITSITVGI